MKIVFLLQVASTFVQGGTELQTDLIMNEAQKAGHEVVCVSDKMGDPGPGIDGVEYIYLKNRDRKLSVLNIFSLTRTLKNIDPDIIYQRYRIPYTGIAAWYAKRHSRKMVFNMANVRDPRKNKVGMNRMFPIYFLNEHIGRFGVKNATAIVAQTDEQREILRQNYNRDSVVIRTGHPIPLPPFEKSDPPIVLWVSNIKPVKRLELFLDLAQELKDTPAKVIYVGRSSERAFNKVLNERVKELSNVEYLGELSLEETNRLIARATALVNTSISEGFPNTFVQAWMRETPVVSLNVDPDRLLNEKGIGICSGHFERFVSDVRSVIENKEKRDSIGKRAREYAIANHDIGKVGKMYLDLFDRLLRTD